MKIRFRSICWIATLLWFSCLYAQGHHTLWTKTYGGTYNDAGHSVQGTSDGGYITAGCTYSFGAGGADVYLVKTDADGDKSWEKTYGGTNNDVGNSVEQTADGGYIVAGYTYSYGAGNRDIYLIKSGANGSVQWTKTYGGTYSDGAKSVNKTSDGGFIIAGYTYSYGAGNLDVYLIKTDANGDTLWTKTYGGTNNDVGNSVEQTADGGYVVAGYTCSFGSGDADVYLTKIDENGNMLWTKTYGGAYNDEGYSVQQTSDNGYIIAGCIGMSDGINSDIYLVKTDSTGDTLWTKSYGGGSTDVAYSVQEEIFGEGYFAAGETSSGSGSDVYLIKTDASGNDIWTMTFGGKRQDIAYSIQEMPDSGCIVAGYTYSSGSGGSDVYLIRTAPPPNPEIWMRPSSFEVRLQARDSTSRLLTIGNSGDDALTWNLNEDPLVSWLLEETVSGVIYPGDSVNVTVIFDSTELIFGDYSTTMVVTSNDTSDPGLYVPVKLTIVEDPSEDSLLTVCPNPYVPKRGHDNINFINLPNKGGIELYTINGDLVWRHDLNQSDEIYSWDAKVEGKAVATGVYIYLIKNRVGKILKKDKLSIIR